MQKNKIEKKLKENQEMKLSERLVGCNNWKWVFMGSMSQQNYDIECKIVITKYDICTIHNKLFCLLNYYIWIHRRISDDRILVRPNSRS